MLLRLRTPAANDRGPLYAEQAFAALHEANAQRLPLRLIFGTHAGNVGLFVGGPSDLQSLVETQLYANYPDCILDRLPEDAFGSISGNPTLSTDIRLIPDLFPCRRFAQFEDSLNRVTADPLMGILSTLGELSRKGFTGRIELVVRPAGYWRPAQARRCLHRFNHPFFRTKPRLSRFYARAAMSTHAWLRIVGRMLSLPARRAAEHSTHDPLNVSASRLHEREEDLQAASDKLGRAAVRRELKGPRLPASSWSRCGNS